MPAEAPVLSTLDMSIVMVASVGSPMSEDESGPKVEENEAGRMTLQVLYNGMKKQLSCGLIVGIKSSH